MDRGIVTIVEEYSSTLFRICLCILCNEQDAEDSVQETFFRLIDKTPTFKDRDHEKAWLIRVAINICKDMLRKRVKYSFINIDEVHTYCLDEQDCKVLEEVMRLPEKLKTVVLLYYAEGYKISEVAGILKIGEGAVKKRLQRAREKLKVYLEVD